MDFNILPSATPESTGVSSVVVSQSVSQWILASYCRQHRKLQGVSSVVVSQSVSQSVDFSVLLSATPESTGVSSIVVSQSVSQSVEF